MKTHPCSISIFAAMAVSSLSLCVAVRADEMVIRPLGKDLNPIEARPIASAGEIFYPVIRGQGSNNVVAVRQVVWFAHEAELTALVFYLNKSGDAIYAASTNDVYFFKGRLFTATRAADRSAYLNISESFGTNVFSAENALRFLARTEKDYAFPNSPHSKFIDVTPILQSENKVLLAAGNTLRHTELLVEDEKLVLLFESYTHRNGKVVLDDQLNPILMAITSVPIVEAPQQTNSQPPAGIDRLPLRYK